MKNPMSLKSFVPDGVGVAAAVFALATVLPSVTPALGQESSVGPAVTKLPKNQVVATITVGSAPQGIVVTPDTKYVYVANSGSISLSKIDTMTNSVVLTIPLSYSPGALAITPDGSQLYVANFYADSVSVVDTTTDTVTTTIALNEGPSYLAVTPDGTEVYALCNDEEADGIVAIIDTATNQLSSATINIGGFPQALVFTADGGTAYEVNDPATYVSVIDTASESITGKLTIKREDAGGLALLPNGSKLYVTGDTESIADITIATKKRKQIVLPQGTTFSTPALTPNGKFLYDPSGNAGSNAVVYMIDTNTNLVTGNPIAVGNQPWKIAISSNARRAYVTNYADGTVSVINISL